MAFHESSKRSFVKTISYRIIIIISTAIVSFLFTGNLNLTLGITAVTGISNTVLYYVNERVWNNINWGKKENK